MRRRADRAIEAEKARERSRARFGTQLTRVADGNSLDEHIVARAVGRDVTSEGCDDE